MGASVSMDELEIRFVGDLQRVHYEPGDTMVLRFPDSVPANRNKDIANWLKGQFPDCRVIVLTEGIQLGVLSKADDQPNE